MFVTKWRDFRFYTGLVSRTLGKQASDFVFYVAIYSIGFCFGYYLSHISDIEHPIAHCIVLLLITLASYFISLYAVKFLIYSKALWLKLRHPELVWATYTDKTGWTCIAVVPEDISEKPAEEILSYLKENYFKIRSKDYAVSVKRQDSSEIG